MKNMVIFGLSIAGASFAAGSLWNMDVDAYQVQVPETVACDKTGADFGAACYNTTGGWWFAYTGDAGNMSFNPIGENDNGTPKLITTDESDGSIIPGGNLIKGSGLFVELTTSGGESGAPAIAGIGFNWTKKETAINIADKPGVCIAYSWTGADALQFELDWDKVKAYDSYYATLPAGTGKVLSLPWAEFDKDNWDKVNDFPIADALSGSKAFKIRLKNPTAAVQKGILTIHDLGWSNETCVAATAVTTVKPNAVLSVKSSSGLQSVLAGRNLSFSGMGNQALQVEVVNFHGQVVANGVVNTVKPSLNLSNLGSGVYMVRAQGDKLSMTRRIAIH